MGNGFFKRFCGAVLQKGISCYLANDAFIRHAHTQTINLKVQLGF